jgi:hypothetical protein
MLDTHNLDTHNCDMIKQQRNKYRTLTDDHLILGNVDNFPCETEYKPQSSKVYSTTENAHAGQRKLLMSEIQFMTRVHTSRAGRYHDINPDASFLCVYAGACPCTHLDQLMAMFPNVLFVLVDPAFDKPENKRHVRNWPKNRVVVWKEKFNTDIIDIINTWCQLQPFKNRNMQFEHIPSTYRPYFQDLNNLQLVDWDHREDLLFISDIRLSAREEAGIAADMDHQALWFRQLQATYGLLKFRLPYVTEQWMANYRIHNYKREYLKGDVYMPIWGPRSTTECRLFVERGCAMSSYDPVLHERQFAGFNRYDRKMQYRYRNKCCNSFDEAATESVKFDYRNYVSRFIPHFLRWRYNSGLNVCESIERL